MRTAYASRNRAIALCALTLLALACSLTGGGTPSLQTPATARPATQPPAPTASTTGSAGIPADACFSGIVPGQTTREQLIATLGQPTLAIEQDGKETLGYPSFISEQYDVFVISAGKVALVGMQLNPDVFSLTQLRELVGEPEQVAYSEYMSGARTYLYPGQGLIFIVQPEADLVFYQECVPPMSLDQYLATWGKDLPLENPHNE